MKVGTHSFAWSHVELLQSLYALQKSANLFHITKERNPSAALVFAEKRAQRVWNCLLLVFFVGVSGAAILLLVLFVVVGGECL